MVRVDDTQVWKLSKELKAVLKGACMRRTRKKRGYEYDEMAGHECHERLQQSRNG